MTILAFDPGATTGWAAFRESAKGHVVVAAGALVYPAAVRGLVAIFAEHQRPLKNDLNARSKDV